MFSLILCLILSSGNLQTKQIPTVEVVVFEHFYDDQNKHSYDQLVLFEKAIVGECIQLWVTDWKLVDLINEPKNQGGYTFHVIKRGEYYYFTLYNPFQLNKQKFYFRSKIFRETTSYKDIERLNKKILDEKFRFNILKENKQN